MERKKWKGERKEDRQGGQEFGKKDKKMEKAKNKVNGMKWRGSII
jgi:hypothetical protein